MANYNNFSMSVSSINSNFSTSSSKSIKSSTEYRSLRQQFFQLQSSHNSLKLVHEREMILASNQKYQLQEQIQKLQNELEEIKKDQVFILNSENETLTEFKKVKIEKEEIEKSLKSKIFQLEEDLKNVKESLYNTESELTKLKLQNMEKIVFEYDEEFLKNILNQWKQRVIELTEKNNLLEEKLSKDNFEKDNNTHYTSNTDPEELRQKILSTYVSLESAQLTLNQKQSEILKISSRIGNAKILEEKYREAQIKIKRLENQLNESSNENIDSPSTKSLTHSTSESDLKLIQLTQEIGNLKESLALTNLNFSSLQSELEISKSSQINLQSQLQESIRTISKLNNSIKVKDSTISGLKEQLDSTVNLLTETLKKKNKQ